MRKHAQISINLSLIALVIGCSGKPVVPAETEDERNSKLLNGAASVELKLSHNPWEEFEPAVRELVHAFRLIPTDSANSDLSISIDLRTGFSEQGYMKKVRVGASDNSMGPVLKYDVGFVAKGKFEIKSSALVLREFEINGSVGGPSSLDLSNLPGEKAKSKQKALQETLAELCHVLIQIYPERIPIDLIENGKTEAREACLDWQRNGKSRRLVMSKILEVGSTSDLLVRAINSLQIEDLEEPLYKNQSKFRDYFPTWLHSPDVQVQTKAAEKLIEMDTVKGRIAKTDPWMVQRYYWILESIPTASDQSRTILVQSILPGLKGIRAGSYPDDEWETNCDLTIKLHSMRQEFIDDPISEIRYNYEIDSNSTHEQLEMAFRRISIDIQHPRINLLYRLNESERRNLLKKLHTIQLRLGDNFDFGARTGDGKKINLIDSALRDVAFHCDANLRKLAIEELSINAARLRTIAHNDPDPIVRKTALKKLQ